jgi:hypothetical protein
METVDLVSLTKRAEYRRSHCDVIHCYVKCQPEIYWLVNQSKVQPLMLDLVGTISIIKTMFINIVSFYTVSRED